MNILINTPLLKSPALKENFDNKVLIIFLTLITALIVLGLVFIDFMKSQAGNSPKNSEETRETPQTSTISL